MFILIILDANEILGSISFMVWGMGYWAVFGGPRPLAGLGEGI